MTKKRKVSVQVRSNFAELWRYNIYLICGHTTHEGESIEVVSAQSKAASVGEALQSAPGGFDGARTLKLALEVEYNLEVYVYVVPHTLPRHSRTDECRPFDLRVKVTSDEETLHNTIHKINQWSGESIVLKF